MNIIFKVLAIILAILLGSILILVFVLIIYSPGKSESYLDSNGKVLTNSISEKVFVNIGGIRQGMFIKSKNLDNPVLLYLHGGIPDYFLSGKYPTGLEDYFTVVWWEQRGSGLSYSADIPKETMNKEQMLSDTKELTNYLRSRFGQEKIYLMGRSGGSYLGIQAVARTPELYHAYIGVGQMSDHLKSEKMAYEYMLEKYRDAGNRKMLRKLEASPVTDSIPYGYLKLRDQAMHLIGIGTTHEMNSIITGLFIPSLTCREHTLKEKFNLWKSKAQSGVHPLWDEMIATDLVNEVNEVKIPVYFFHGIYDYTVSYPLAKKFLEEIHAPLKGFYTFEYSAHSPIFEEPQRVHEIMVSDILQGKITMADKLIINY
ncbi:MAG: alpha/beta hydrolase [Bacteroidales bacterium]|nr:alpha/beta hydrolase [Bacteroidales bacterium]MCF8392142.1 alpha/beta hydrolase [Bacteroidales bacterium]